MFGHQDNKDDSSKSDKPAAGTSPVRSVAPSTSAPTAASNNGPVKNGGLSDLDGLSDLADLGLGDVPAANGPTKSPVNPGPSAPVPAPVNKPIPAPAPVPKPVVNVPAPSPAAPRPSVTPTAPAPTPRPAAPVATASAGGPNLHDLKLSALHELTPLVEQLDQTPEDHFRTMMMMIQSTDEQTLLPNAYDAAHQIEDSKVRAQALLDVVNEINYFQQPSSDK